MRGSEWGRSAELSPAPPFTATSRPKDIVQWRNSLFTSTWLAKDWWCSGDMVAVCIFENLKFKLMTRTTCNLDTFMLPVKSWELTSIYHLFFWNLAVRYCKSVKSMSLVIRRYLREKTTKNVFVVQEGVKNQPSRNMMTLLQTVFIGARTSSGICAFLKIMQASSGVKFLLKAAKE